MPGAFRRAAMLSLALLQFTLGACIGLLHTHPGRMGDACRDVCVHGESPAPALQAAAPDLGPLQTTCPACTYLGIMQGAHLPASEPACERPSRVNQVRTEPAVACAWQPAAQHLARAPPRLS